MSADFSDSDFEDDTLDEIFTAAADHVQHSHSAYLPNDLLELYALYKQATVGHCNTTKPGIFNMQARAKWNAWFELGDMPAVQAKQSYIEKLKALDGEWLKNQEAVVKSKSLHNWVVHSTELPPSDHHKAEHEKDSFDYVKEGDIERLRVTLQTDQLHQLDEHGMGLIHWATDRNNVAMLEFLISNGADVNLRDGELQTALHYAASCGHLECIRVLLNANALRSCKDAEGLSCIDVAENEEVRTILQI